MFKGLWGCNFKPPNCHAQTGKWGGSGWTLSLVDSTLRTSRPPGVPESRAAGARPHVRMQGASPKWIHDFGYRFDFHHQEGSLSYTV